MKEKQAICFDDILLVPQDSDVQSRHDVDLQMLLGNMMLRLPVIAAPMDTVTGVDMAVAMEMQGGLGIIHRYMSEEEQITNILTLEAMNCKTYGVAIPSNNGYLKTAERYYEAGARVFCVDTANGHGTYAVEAIKKLSAMFSNSKVHLMAGNVATGKGFTMLADAGAHSVRVGIGGGSVCTTRSVSGHGVPTLQSIFDVATAKDNLGLGTGIVADGGIRTSGDMVKAFAAGADAVMVGSMLAGTDQAPGDLIHNNDASYKSFRGMASKRAQEDATGGFSVEEGIETLVKYKGSVYPILNQVRGGLGSGCSYSGVNSLSQLSNFAEYVKVSPMAIHETRPQHEVYNGN